MKIKARVIIIRAAGTNCDVETADAFRLAGGLAETVHINALIKGEKKLDSYDILAIPGGFSYGDDIAAGRVMANRLRYSFYRPLQRFIDSGRPVIGICNGFQVLVKAGFLPFGRAQSVSLTYNDCGSFVCRWVSLNLSLTGKKSFWTDNLPGQIELPIAHGEGKFYAEDNILEEIEQKGLVAFRYGGSENPNGSLNCIAGITNEKGNVLGLMPHPERFVSKYQHPQWSSQNPVTPFGLEIIKNAVKYVWNIRNK